MKSKSKKAVTFLFTSQAQASSAIVQATLNYGAAVTDVECAIEARRAAWGDLRYTVTEAAKAGFTIEVRASKGTLALELQEALRKAGYPTQTIRNMLTTLRGITGVKNTGKRKKAKAIKELAQADVEAGTTINIGRSVTPEQVKNKVIDLGNYLKAQYPDSEPMLRLAAYLVDIE